MVAPSGPIRRAPARSLGRAIALTCAAASLLAIAAIALMSQADACPFCAAAQQTLAEEVTGADAAVFATLVKPMPELALDAAGNSEPQQATATFKIEEILAGEKEIGSAKEIHVVYFGEDKPGQKFLITAIKDNELAWITPLPLSDRAIDYVKELPALAPAGPERLVFFQKYFEDADPLLAQDAYDEFSRAPYKDIVALGPQMEREKLLKWIDDPKVGPASRRLYFCMLSVCGKPEDVPFLEGIASYDYALLKPAAAAAIGVAGLTGSAYGWESLDTVLHTIESRKKESLDALLGCYLNLKGPAGLELVDKQYLANPHVEYKYLHAAIMALRFHGEETTILPREQLLKSMRLALDHKEFADQIIPDLTRWQDWGVMDRLVKMFKDSPPRDWIRQPVASYLLVAAEEPGEVGAKAKTALDEIKTLDPETYERAQSFAGFGMFGGLKTGADGSAASGEGADDNSADAPGNAGRAATTPTPAVDGGSVAAASSEGLPPDPANFQQEDAPQEDKTVAAPAAGEAPGDAESKAPAAATTAATEPDAAVARPLSKWFLIGAPVIGVVVLMAVFAALLKGADPRTSETGK